MSQRVVVTGVGVVSPIGCNPDSFWAALCASRSGIGPLGSIPNGILQVQCGAEAREFTGQIDQFGPMEKGLERQIRKGQKVMCREIEMGVAACQWALHDCGLDASRRDPQRTGIVYGSDYILTRPEEFSDGIAACHDDQGQFHIEQWPSHGLPKLNPLWLLKYLPNMPASHVAIYNDLRGPSNSLTVREASNDLAIAEAAAVIRRGAADCMLAGSTGSLVHPVRSLHVEGQVRLAGDRPNPSEMSRPFQIDRDGIVLGEGAAAFMLESLEHAKRRGAPIYAELVATAAHQVGPRPQRDPFREATRLTIQSLLQPLNHQLPDGWHLHACGRSDPQIDLSESQGMADALGDRLASSPVFCGKGLFGNLGGGSGAVEVAASLMALRNQQFFPTPNRDRPDPQIPLRLADGSESDQATAGFLHWSFSMQGQCSGVAFQRYTED